jgi:hypothetical protein
MTTLFSACFPYPEYTQFLPSIGAIMGNIFAHFSQNIFLNPVVVKISSDLGIHEIPQAVSQTTHLFLFTLLGSILGLGVQMTVFVSVPTLVAFISVETARFFMRMGKEYLEKRNLALQDQDNKTRVKTSTTEDEEKNKLESQHTSNTTQTDQEYEFDVEEKINNQDKKDGWIPCSNGCGKLIFLSSQVGDMIGTTQCFKCLFPFNAQDDSWRRIDKFIELNDDGKNEVREKNDNEHVSRVSTVSMSSKIYEEVDNEHCEEENRENTVSESVGKEANLNELSNEFEEGTSPKRVLRRRQQN